MRQSNAVRNRTGSNSASGPDYYGFSQLVIAKLIQELPGARDCAKYKWQVWQAGSREHAVCGLVLRGGRGARLCEQDFIESDEPQGSARPAEAEDLGETLDPMEDDEVALGGDDGVGSDPPTDPRSQAETAEA
jgi:hypothetical protein